MEISKEFIDALGVRIRNLRKGLGLTQVAYASMINLDERNLRRIENGHQMPSHMTMFQIAGLHKVHVSELLKHLPHGDHENSLSGLNVNLLDTLRGEWLGSIEQTNLEKAYPATMIVQIENGIYTGEIDIYVLDSENNAVPHNLRKFRITNITTHEPRIFTIMYDSLNPDINQHGVFLIQLDGKGENVSGAVVAYGGNSGFIINGTIRGSKKP